MKQAIILAAGEGWRLRPFTVNRPKVMLPVAGKPILQYMVEALAQNGIRNIVMVVGYKREQIFDYMGSGEQLASISPMSLRRSAWVPLMPWPRPGKWPKMSSSSSPGIN